MYKAAAQFLWSFLLLAFVPACGSVLGVDLDDPPRKPGTDHDASANVDATDHDRSADVTVDMASNSDGAVEQDVNTVRGDEMSDTGSEDAGTDEIRRGDADGGDGDGRSGPPVDRVTYTPALGKYDNLTQRGTSARLGAVYDDTLSPTTLSPKTFGFLFSIPTLGRVHAQVLYAEGVPGATPHDRLFIADDRNNVYAYDRSTVSAAPAWQKPLGKVWRGPTPAGIIGTPVLTPDKKRLFLVSQQDDAGTSRHYLYTFDTDTGDILSKVEVVASLRGPGDNLVAEFVSASELQEAALTLVDQQLFVAFAANDDSSRPLGWVMAYDVSTMPPALVQAFVTTPNREVPDASCAPVSNQGGISHTGNGLVADGSGSIFFQAGGGGYQPAAGPNGFRNVGNGVVRLTQSLALDDAWALTYPSDTHVSISSADSGSCESARVTEEAPWTSGAPHSTEFLEKSRLDLGSSAPLLLPSSKLLVGGGEGYWFLLDRYFASSSSPRAVRATHNGQVGTATIADVPGYDQFENGRNVNRNFAQNWPRISGPPVYWGDEEKGTIYVWGAKDALRAYRYTAAGGLEETASGIGRKRARRDANVGANLTVSGVPGSPPIVWASMPLEHDFGTGRRYGGILRAYAGVESDGSLPELWNSGIDPREGIILGHSKRTSPTVAKGLVYLPSWNQLGPDASGQVNVYGPRVSPPRPITLGPDFDGDGQADVIWRDESATGSVSGIWLLHPWMHEHTEGQNDPRLFTDDPNHPGEPPFTVYDEVSIPDAANRGVDWSIVGAGDFDGDGQPDLVWSQSHVDGDGALINDANEIWLTSRFDPVRNELQIRKKVAVIASRGRNWKIVGIGDFDGDGISDLMWRHYVEGLNSMWIMDRYVVGAAEPIQPRLFPVTVSQDVSSGWDLVGVGADWDGNGISDLVWRCSDGYPCASDTTNNGLWLLDKLDEASNVVPVLDYVQLPKLADTVHWNLAAIGDYNLDARPDLVWWNSGTGETLIWLMQDNTGKQEYGLQTCAAHGVGCTRFHLGPGSTTSPSWRIVGPR